MQQAQIAISATYLINIILAPILRNGVSMKKNEMRDRLKRPGWDQTFISSGDFRRYPDGSRVNRASEQ